MSAIIECKNLSYGYKDFVVTNNLSFDINKGDFVSIIGENGAGKSTFLKVLLKTLKPLKGEINYVGFKQKQIGYLPQITELQKDFPATVWEIILSGRCQYLGFKPFFSRKDKDIAKEKIKLLKIENLIKKRFKDLSGGQRQKVLLARALCGAEELLILDEPVTGLDAESTVEMCKTIEELHNSGLTIIMISHDINHVKSISTHILSVGKNTMYNAKDDYFRMVEKDV